MAEYIERQAAKRLFADTHDYGLARKLDAIPSADVVKVKHGRWVVENEESIRCSECCFNRASIKIPLDYCPNCGARMDGAADKNVGHTIPVNDLYDEDGGEV